jgi:hypothetical protein
MISNKFVIIIVLYKENIYTSKTLISLINIKYSLNGFRIIIFDNSPSCYNRITEKELNKEFEEVEILLYQNEYNMPLSVIYNKTIKMLNKNEYLIIFDHDSIINNEFIKKVKYYTKINPNINLFIPKIKYNNKIISPQKLYYFRGLLWKNILCGINISRFKFAINSGMVINSNYLLYEFPGYNEKIEFYGTDTDFMYKYSKTNKYLFVMDVELEHILNFYEGNKEEKIERYKKMIYSNLILMKTLSNTIYYISKIYWFLSSIKYSLVYKDKRFILFSIWNKKI